jgi:hypothetical protein
MIDRIPIGNGILVGKAANQRKAAKLGSLAFFTQVL